VVLEEKNNKKSEALACDWLCKEQQAEREIVEVSLWISLTAGPMAGRERRYQEHVVHSSSYQDTKAARTRAGARER